MELSKLKSGTDVRGTALDIFGKKVDLGPAEAAAVASAFVVWLEGRGEGKRIAVGRDSRLSSESLASAVIGALVRAGRTVLDCGLCSTPSMFMTTQLAAKADAAIMITASHHPADKNGIKFFLPSGGVGHAELDEIVALAEAEAKPAEGAGEVINGDFLGDYCEFLINKVRDGLGGERPLEGLKIAVDAGNGAGGFYVRRVLEPLGADCTGSRFLDPDGNFPNHIPNPENETAMKFASEATVGAKADLGVIFDTDVDRAAIVGPDGSEINRNSLIALISAIVLAEKPGSTIVTDSVTSDGLAEFIRARGGVHHRFKRGYKNVIDEAVRLGAPLAIETSGHAALAENYYLDDGAYLVTRLIIEAVKARRRGGELTDLIKDLARPKEELEVRLGFKTDKFSELGAFIIESLKKVRAEGYVVAPDNYEGVRVSIPGFRGFFLVRMSVHDPIMPINIESDTTGGAKSIARLLLAYLKEFSGLDTSPLVTACE